MSKMLTRLVGSSVDDGISPFSHHHGVVKTEISDSEGAEKAQTPLRTDQGGQLFELFVFDQVKKNKVDSRYFDGLDFGSHVGHVSADVCQRAAHLCEIAAAFAETEERQKVKHAALTVSPHQMKQELSVVLEMLLSQAETMDGGVITLFYFCLDLSVRMLETKVHPDLLAVLTLVKAAINTAIGPYVEAHGGWAKLGGSAARVLATGFSVLNTIRGFMPV